MAQIEQRSNQNTLIQYDITNALCGEGNVNTIKQESGFWKSYIGSDTTRIKCKLKFISNIITAEVKILNASMIEFTCLYEKQQQTNQLLHFTSKQRQTKSPVNYKFKKDTVQIDQIFIDIHSYNKKQIQIYSIRFYGQPIRKKVNTQKQQLQASKKLQMQKQKIRKQKVVKTQKKQLKPIQEIEKSQKQQKKKRKYTKKTKNHQEDQSSKQEQKEKNNKQANQQDGSIKQRQQQAQMKRQKSNAQKQMFLPQNYSKDELLQVQQQYVQSNYQTTKVMPEQLQRIRNISQSWLQNQRRLQLSFGVRVQHRLSYKLNPKCLYTMKFVLPGIYGEVKSNYVKIIKQLGGRIFEQPCQNCIVVTENPKNNNAVQMANLIANTVIVRPSYIDDCYRAKAKLKTKKYQYRLQDYYT